jgi:hypothetical protein
VRQGSAQRAALRPRIAKLAAAEMESEAGDGHAATSTTTRARSNVATRGSGASLHGPAAVLSPANPTAVAGAELDPEEGKELDELWREHQTSKLKGRGIHRRTKPFHRSRPGETFVSRSHGQLAAIYMEQPGGVWTHVQQPRERPDGMGADDTQLEAADEAVCGAEKEAVEQSTPVQPASVVPQSVAVPPPPPPPPLPPSTAGAPLPQPAPSVAGGESLNVRK